MPKDTCKATKSKTLVLVFVVVFGRRHDDDERCFFVV